jgi:hypothetical protein
VSVDDLPDVEGPQVDIADGSDETLVGEVVTISPAGSACGGTTTP